MTKLLEHENVIEESKQKYIKLIFKEESNAVLKYLISDSIFITSLTSMFLNANRDDRNNLESLLRLMTNSINVEDKIFYSANYLAHVQIYLRSLNTRSPLNKIIIHQQEKEITEDIYETLMPIQTELLNRRSH